MMVELITITIWFFVNLLCIPGISGPFSKWRSWFTRFLWYWAFSCEGFLFLKYLTVNARAKRSFPSLFCYFSTYQKKSSFFPVINVFFRQSFSRKLIVQLTNISFFQVFWNTIAPSYKHKFTKPWLLSKDVRISNHLLEFLSHNLSFYNKKIRSNKLSLNTTIE